MYLKSNKIYIPSYRRLTLLLFSSIASLALNKSTSLALNKSTSLALNKSTMPKYFLMKSEPDVFSINDFAKLEDNTSPWDGVRNFEARKTMKAMLVGDFALMYHSNAKKQTGIVGLMEIVRTAYPDTTCTDPKSKYYDQKADSDDKWVCVDCKLIETFTRPILLDEMKSHDELKEMETFKRSRLSVSHVTKSEFDFICNLGRNTEVPPPQSTNKKRKATDEEKSETVVKKKSSKKAN